MLQQQLQALEAKAKEQFDCSIGDLPAFVDQLKVEAEQAICNAEVILGLREEGESEAPTAKPVVKPMAKKPAVQPGHDEDGL